MTIGVLGGTFNPIHIGHLVLAQEIRIKLNFSKVLFVPSRLPPHKENTVSETHRYEMVKLAIKNNKFFEISDIEMVQKKTSYTINTMKSLYQRYQEPLSFIIGADNIADMPSWNKWNELIRICQFVIGMRPGVNSKLAKEQLKYLKNIHGKSFNAVIIDIPGIEISSTQIRKRFKKNQSIKYFVPDSVIKYIERHSLYN